MKRTLSILMALCALADLAFGTPRQAFFAQWFAAGATAPAPDVPPIVRGLAFNVDARDYAALSGYLVTNLIDRTGIRSATNYLANYGASSTVYGARAALLFDSARSMKGYAVSPGVPCTNNVLVIQVHTRTINGRNCGLANSTYNNRDYAFNLNNNTAAYIGLGTSISGAFTPSPTGGVMVVTAWRTGTNCVLRMNGVEIGRASLAASANSMNIFGFINATFNSDGMYLHSARAWTNETFTLEEVQALESFEDAVWDWSP